MIKKSLNVLMRRISIMPIMLMAVMSVGLISCGGDDDGDDTGGSSSALGDYYFQCEVVDRGTFSDAQASQFMGALNSELPVMEAYTKDQAIYVFDRSVEDIRVTYSGANDFELSFRVKLMLKTSTIKSKVVSIKRNGCTVN